MFNENNTVCLRYNPGMNEKSVEATTMLDIHKCLTVYGTDTAIAVEGAIDAVKKEIKRLCDVECPKTLFCGDDDAWYWGMQSRIHSHEFLIADLEAGEDQLTTTQAGILYNLFPELQKGILIETAYKEAEYGVTHRMHCPDMQENTNARAAMKILQDLTLIDDQRPMERLPRTGEDYDSLVVGEDISYNKSRKALKNLQDMMENCFRWLVTRPGSPDA